MKHFPIYLKMTGKRVCIIGNDDDGVAKARLVAKSDAVIEIYADAPEEGLSHYITAQAGVVIHHLRHFQEDDISDSARPAIAFVYLTAPDHSLQRQLNAAHIPYCVIDNLAESSFVTPAIVDRAPVTIAIGTEGTAPVLARRLKRELESRLPHSYGALARVAGRLRSYIAVRLGAPERRHFWARYFETASSRLTDDDAQSHAQAILTEMRLQSKALLPTALMPVWFVGAGPGSPDLLTLQARRLLDEADIVLHDRLVPPAILELCRREAEVICVGKTGFGASWQQDDINQLLIKKAQTGLRVVRLKSGDATIYGRLDEEIAALTAKDIAFDIAPGLTSAAAGAAIMGASLTVRGRNSGYRVLTGHDVNGYADYDWREMAKGLQDRRFTASVYMSVRAAPYLAGRLLMHDAPHDLVVTVASHISQTQEGWLVTRLGNLASDMKRASLNGPAIIYIGLAPHEANLARLNQISFPQEAVYVSEQA